MHSQNNNRPLQPMLKPMIPPRQVTPAQPGGAPVMRPSQPTAQIVQRPAAPAGGPIQRPAVPQTPGVPLRQTPSQAPVSQPQNPPRTPTQPQVAPVVKQAAAPAQGRAIPAHMNQQQNNNNVPQNYQQFQNQVEANYQPPAQIYPISSLNPYQPRWTIKARVIHKATRQYENDRGTGNILSITLCDQSGEISCTMFNETAQNFDQRIELNKIYYISKGKIKNAGKFNPVQCDFEMSLSNNSEVIPCLEDDGSVPYSQLKPIPLKDLEEIPDNTLVDVLCVLHSVGDLDEIVAKKDQKVHKKRTLLFLDDSHPDPNTPVTIELTLWRDQAENCPWVGSTIVGIKNARVVRQVPTGTTLATVSSTLIKYSPELPEFQDRADVLQNWYTSLPNDTALYEMTKPFQGTGGGGNYPLTTLREGRDSAVGQEKPSTFTIRGTVMKIKHDDGERAAPLYYTSCPSADGCKKKVTQNEQTGLWECQKCNQAYTDMIPRYILSLLVGDVSGSQWMNAFDDSGEHLIGRTAMDIYQLKTANDMTTLNTTFSAACYRTYNIRIKAAEEPFGDDTRMRCTIMGVSEIDYVSGSHDLIRGIYTMCGQEPPALG